MKRRDRLDFPSVRGVVQSIHPGSVVRPPERQTNGYNRQRNGCWPGARADMFAEIPPLVGIRDPQFGAGDGIGIYMFAGDGQMASTITAFPPCRRLGGEQHAPALTHAKIPPRHLWQFGAVGWPSGILERPGCPETLVESPPARTQMLSLPACEARWARASRQARLVRGRQGWWGLLRQATSGKPKGHRDLCSVERDPVIDKVCHKRHPGGCA